MSYNWQISYKTNGARGNSMIARPNRIIWSICEDDIRAAARDRGIRPSEQQMDDIARYIERGLSAVCNWFMVVDMAFHEVVGDRSSSQAGVDEKLQ